MTFLCRQCDYRFRFIWSVVVNGARQEPVCPKCKLPFYIVEEEQ